MPPSESESPPEQHLPPEPGSERQFPPEPTSEHLLPREHSPRRAGSDAGQFAQEPPDANLSYESLVSITLSRNQVDHVVRAALGEDAVPSISGAVAGTGFHRTQARQVLSSRYRALQENRRLSRSLLVDRRLSLPPEGSDMGIKDISEQLQLNTSTVHRYVNRRLWLRGGRARPDMPRYRLLPE